jgi:hypothetical protein
MSNSYPISAYVTRHTHEVRKYRQASFSVKDAPGIPSFSSGDGNIILRKRARIVWLVYTDGLHVHIHIYCM